MNPATAMTAWVRWAALMVAVLAIIGMGGSTSVAGAQAPGPPVVVSVDSSVNLPAVLGVVLSGVRAAPLEDQLSAGTTGFLRLISKRFRQMRRVIVNALARWQSWLGGALAFLGIAVMAPVLDRAVIDVWRREGLAAFARALTAGAAVYVRLLRDGRAPAVGKALIAFAVVYGVAQRDLMPDPQGMVGGFADDLVLLVLASRGFMRMCEDELVEEHALRVAAARRVS